MRRQRISLPGGRGIRRKMFKETNYSEEYKQKNYETNSAFFRRGSKYRGISNSNLEQHAECSHTQFSTNKGKDYDDLHDDLRVILNQRKGLGMTSATATTNMDVSASVAVPAETNNIDAHVHCVNEMSPERFLRLTSQRMDTLEVTEKDFNLLAGIAYKATVLSMRIKEKKTEEDLKRDVNAPTFIPGLTLVEQSYGSPSEAKSEFLQDAEDMYQDKNSAPSIERSNASTVYKELVEEARYRLCNKRSSTSVATPSKEPLSAAKMISGVKKILKKLKNNNDNKKIALVNLPPSEIHKISPAEQRKLIDEANKSIREFIDYLEACKTYELSPVHSKLCSESPSTSIAIPVKEPLNSAKIISEAEKLVKKLIEINEANIKFTELFIPPTQICEFRTAKQTRLNGQATKFIKEFIEYLEVCKRSELSPVCRERRIYSPYAEGSAFTEEVKTKKVEEALGKFIEPKEDDKGIPRSVEHASISTLGTFLETTNNSCYKSPATSGEQSHASVPTVGRKFLPEIRKHKPVYETPAPKCACPSKDFHYVDCSLRHTTLNKF
ncbi:uncharacterized protein LOC129961111 isoform X2 [Argiope bruennichi]|uniref:uncharacterized protein LOC129961111 isoform X2 n=1 Tax=Argiope bruennichi TaxID=94029 RepID=UPI00249509E4|nr:uncharacterized protein LOC129961111 isoform X2 [Argiope bruennichi]